MTVAASTAGGAKPPSPSAKNSQFISGRDEDDEPQGSHKLSRAERKRLRKQQGAGRDEDE